MLPTSTTVSHGFVVVWQRSPPFGSHCADWHSNRRNEFPDTANTADRMEVPASRGVVGPRVEIFAFTAHELQGRSVRNDTHRFSVCEETVLLTHTVNSLVRVSRRAVDTGHGDQSHSNEVSDSGLSVAPGSARGSDRGSRGIPGPAPKPGGTHPDRHATSTPPDPKDGSPG